MAGHNYAITFCLETGKTFILSNAEDPIMLQDKELEEIKNAYMLVFSKTNLETDAPNNSNNIHKKTYKKHTQKAYNKWNYYRKRNA